MRRCATPSTPASARKTSPRSSSRATPSGTRTWNGKITLTDSDFSQAGAAWSPTLFPPVQSYDLTWSFRVGPGNTSGDGLAFAVIDADGAPGVGGNGSGIGLQNLPGPDGGLVSGYAVVLDTYKNSNDPTDLGPATLKLFVLPAFTVIANIAVPETLNDGNVYAIDVSWRAPGTLSATLHAPGGLITVSGMNAGFAVPGSATIGFTASTGGSANSHNEIAGLTITDACD